MGGLYGTAIAVGRVAGAVALLALVLWLVLHLLAASRNRARVRARSGVSPLPGLRGDVGGLGLVGPDARPIPWPASGGPREIACSRGDREYRRDTRRFIDSLAARGLEVDELRIERRDR